MSGKIKECKLEYEQLEKQNKHLIKDALKTRQTTNSNECDIRYLKRVVERRSIKINVSNSFGSGGA